MYIHVHCTNETLCMKECMDELAAFSLKNEPGLHYVMPGRLDYCTFACVMYMYICTVYMYIIIILYTCTCT